MKLLKLIGLLILIAGNVILILNWDSVTGKNDDRSAKNNDNIGLSPTPVADQPVEDEPVTNEDIRDVDPEVANVDNTKQTDREQILAWVKESAAYSPKDARRANNLVKIREKKDAMTHEEMLAIEAVLNMSQYKGPVKLKVAQFLKDKQFNSYDDLINARKEIIKLNRLFEEKEAFEQEKRRQEELSKEKSNGNRTVSGPQPTTPSKRNEKNEPVAKDEKSIKRAEILKLVQEGIKLSTSDRKRKENLVKVREISEVLSKREKLAVEAMLNLEQYSGKVREQVVMHLGEVKLKSFDDIMRTQNEIIYIESKFQGK